MMSSSFSFCGVLLCLCLGGCASTAYAPPLVKTSCSPVLVGKTTPASLSSSGLAVSSTDGQQGADLERLTLLWQGRIQEGVTSDYPIGPGDVLEVSVADLEELSGRTVRVSGEGTIALPLIGVVRASGLSENELREEIQRQLEAGYMYDPHVTLFVREYRSRQVAVLGAVARPGLYSLASGADTILDMLALAGGMTEEAAARINFMPATPVANGRAKELASILPVQLGSKDPASLTLKRTDPIVIDLKSLTTGGNQISLALPVRPGDVIMVPNSGDVLVEGWVDKPGSHKITPGLTVLGVVAAAGGPVFAADTSSVKVIRTGKEWGKIFFVVDLEKIKRGESLDIPVQEGDIIEVPSSAVKLVPYSFYRFLLRVGVSAPLY